MGRSDVSWVRFIDPVCWRKVAPGNGNLRAAYRMRTYFFCSTSCRKAFLVDPETYLEIESSRVKGRWKLYLKRLKASISERTV